MSFIKRTTFLFLFFFTLNSAVQAQCKISEIIAQGKIKISEPYLYDGFVITEFILDKETKTMQTKFIALKGQQYKLYFCTSGFDEELNISLKSDDSDDKLFDQKANKDCIIFELNKAGNYTIEYQVPLAENAEYGNIKNECVVMLISYKSK
jgi:hypothetical protein